MAQMKAMIRNLISELISFLKAYTVNEKDKKNLTFILQRYLHLLVLSVLSNMSNYMVKY